MGSAQTGSAPFCLYEAPLSFFAPVAALAPSDSVIAAVPCPLPEADAEQENTSDAACWLASANLAADANDFELAGAYLAALEASFPQLRDRFALTRGDWSLLQDDADAARAAFTLARRSPDSTTRLQAEIGLIRAQAQQNPGRAKTSLTSLIRRFPRLPERNNLRLEIAAAYASQDDTSRAIALYQHLDLEAPGSGAATIARQRLSTLREAGASLPRYSAEQEIRRIEAWMRSGPFSEAKAAMTSITEREVRLSSDQSARLALMQARIARIEGRFGDASRLLNQGRNSSTLDTDERERIVNRAQEMASAARGMTPDRARTQIHRIRRGRPLLRLRAAQLLRIIDLAVEGGLEAEATRALSLLPRKDVSGDGQFKAAMRSMGVASAEATRATLERLADTGRIDARYHFARILESEQQEQEARAYYEGILRDDRSAERYYSMWARLRLQALALDQAEVSNAVTSESALLTSNGAAAVSELPSEVAPLGEGLLTPGTILDGPQNVEAELGALAEQLSPIAEAHAAAYPWLDRAKVLLTLGDATAASDELTEALIAWREASGRPLRRMGLEAVSRGTERARTRLDRDVRRDRRALTGEERQVIATVAMALGDAGTYVALTGWHAADERPRAYEQLVVEAAQRHSVDPNLLLAVMRVESVFQRRIVSYAGAVGLMQIMPRTGENIADAIGHDEFTTEDLLKAEVNIEFAAWYLASLIERFDGRLPLAIASYNGGPHNVRRWIAGRSELMPLDAMLELIPFGQTHRYVRRVLTHYEAYRTQQSLPMTELSTELPVVGIDQLAF